MIILLDGQCFILFYHVFILLYLFILFRSLNLTYLYLMAILVRDQIGMACKP